jgi:hypothetical protein
MSITFNVDEIFEMAEEIERNGAKFYREAQEYPEQCGEENVYRVGRDGRNHERSSPICKDLSASMKNRRFLTRTTRSPVLRPADFRHEAKRLDKKFTGKKS